MAKLSDYDYCLPQELIAQRPATTRDSSRLLVLDKRETAWSHRKFGAIVDLLSEGDVLVLNDTKVISARLIGKRATGGRVEVFLLQPADPEGYLPAGKSRYRALIKPLGRLKLNEKIYFKGNYSCRLLDAKKRIVEFSDVSAQKVMEKIGLIPLPPYIHRVPDASDLRRYQTVFAKHRGAVAAPTAGLHFTKTILTKLKQKGVRIAFLTLHVNYGTFSPVTSDDVRDHKMQEEYYNIPASTVASIRQAKKNKKRVFAVGTTVTKALEECAQAILSARANGPFSGWSRLFIYPPFSFKIVDALLTNFHLPRTSLLMLVAAFSGHDFILKAYQEAVKKEYRFYSYGDVMCIQ